MSCFIRQLFRWSLLPILRFLYPTKVLGAEHMPDKGGVLLVSNHVSYIDAFILTAASPRPVRFVIFENFMKVKAFSWFLVLFGAVPISPTKAKQAIRQTAEAINEGTVVCIFPEGQLTRMGVLNDFKKGYELIARKAKCPVVPVYMDGLWGSIFTYERGRYFNKKPRAIQRRLRIAFGEPAEATEATESWLRLSLLRLGHRAFSARPELETSLAEFAIRALKRAPNQVCFAERSQKGERVFTRLQVLTTATSLAKRWRTVLPADEKRIGVWLPPGFPPALMNLALVVAGKVPVNLAFDPKTVQSQIQLSGVKTVVTSQAFAKLLDGVEATFLDMKGEMSATNTPMLPLQRIRNKWEPTWLAVRRHLREMEFPQDEAVAYVSPEYGLISNRSRDLIANALQIASTNFLPADESVFCEEPLNSAAGQAFSCWVPLLNAIPVEARPYSRQEIPGDLAFVESEFFIGGPALVEQFESALPDGVHTFLVFDKASGLIRMIGETNVLASTLSDDATGQILALSMIHPEAQLIGHQHQIGHRADTFGRLLPGIMVEPGENTTLTLPGGKSIEVPLGEIDSDGLFKSGPETAAS